MFKYKNVTKGILKFRALDTKLVKKVFEVKPGEEIEVGVEINWGGLEKISEKEKSKRIGGKR